ncbi:MAG: 4-(cytidine 5'-diphospho)-2-C-methyl-D-erythritol kinase [Streptosporangiaceae bacterium]
MGSAAAGGRYHRIIVTAVTARVPAKVNLQLSVGPPRTDGYHDLVTVFHALALFDEVTVAPADTDSVRVSGEGASSVPLDSGNLAARAVTALIAAVGPGCRDAPGVAIEIRKRIPVAAGLAGGSADAAGALVACNELWGTGLSQQELAEIAGRVGSDVAFALHGGTAVGLGRGDQVTPALVAGTYHWVLAFAAEQLSTPAVYAACDRLRAAQAGRAGAGPAPGPQLSTALMAALRSGDPAEVGPLLDNDLQPAAISLQPRLRRALAAGREQGALGAIVSGSGPTCAYLARDAIHARDLAVALTGAGVCRSVVTVTGPAPGATVLSPATGQRR